jgi:hypothetical protein
MTSAIKVDKGVPLPSLRGNYPYATMAIGDSFLMPGKSLQVACNSNYRASKKLGKKFIARNGEDGVRIWRSA